jgi:hypothetical protein
MPPQSLTLAASEKYLYGNIKNKSKKLFKMTPFPNLADKYHPPTNHGFWKYDGKQE